MKYYKILNKQEKHHNLQYQTGINVDQIPFNPNGDCKPGGIYFASEDILAFLDYGCWIREVTLPDKEEIYENPGNPKKFKAHSVILGERREINLELIKELVSEGANVNADDDYPLRCAASNGYLEIVQHLISVGANVHSCDDMALRCASSNGHLEIVKFLVSVGANVHAIDDYPLQWAAQNGHLEIVQYLVSVGANVHVDYDYPLRCASNNGHRKIVKYLKSLK